MKEEITFYDTSSLLELKNLENIESFYISSITLEELEHIKIERDKSSTLKYQARFFLRWIDKNLDKVNIVLFKEDLLSPIICSDFSISNDTKILATALSLVSNYHVNFVTQDLSLKSIAKSYLVNTFYKEDFSVSSIDLEIKNDYCGYREEKLSDDQLNDIYSDVFSNSLGLATNEYLIVYNQNNEITDKLCWDGKRYRNLSYKEFKSHYMGEIKAMSGDVYQQLASDSLLHHQITMLTGPAGSGKTMLSLSYAMSELEMKKKDKIVIICNPAPAKDAIELGFYKGTREEKVLDTSIGTILSSKFHDGMEDVEELLRMGKIDIIPVVDARGMDLSNQNAILYVPEAQNLNIYLMQIILQRAAEDTKIIIDGDYNTQVDLSAYDDGQNGMRKLSEVFKGSELFGQVDLKVIHRSKIAELAQKMM